MFLPQAHQYVQAGLAQISKGHGQAREGHPLHQELVIQPGSHGSLSSPCLQYSFLNLDGTWNKIKIQKIYWCLQKTLSSRHCLKIQTCRSVLDLGKVDKKKKKFVFSTTFHKSATILKNTASSKWQSLAAVCSDFWYLRLGEQGGVTATAVPHAVPECLSPVTPTQDSALTSQNQWQLLTPLLLALCSKRNPHWRSTGASHFG